MGEGNKVEGAQLQPSSNQQTSTIFGNSLGGQVMLSLAGACQYFDESTERLNIEAKKLSATMVTNVIYTYELAARRSYQASYNLSTLLRRIERKTRNGGFFSTSVTHSIIEDEQDSDWFTINFSLNTGDFDYSPEEQHQITREIKQELLDKAMRQFAVLSSGPAIPPPLPDLVPSGARVAANELGKCWHWGCQVASATLGVADSIWGKNSATANFHRNNAAWAHESVNGIQFVNRSGSLGFKAE